jgi:hypothetical protein
MKKRLRFTSSKFQHVLHEEAVASTTDAMTQAPVATDTNAPTASVVATESPPTAASDMNAATQAPATADTTAAATDAPQLSSSAADATSQTNTSSDASLQVDPTAQATEIAIATAIAPVVVLDSGGSAVPLASVAAEKINATGDPIWCPAGKQPGDASCKASYAYLAALVAGLSGVNQPTGDGTI